MAEQPGTREVRAPRTSHARLSPEAFRTQGTPSSRVGRRLLSVTKPNRLLLGTTEVAELLGVPIKTLYSWRLSGRGPKSVLLPNRTLKYRMSDIEEWLEALEENERR